MQKYVFVYLMQHLGQGTQFHMKDWPLHITISPRFAINATPEYIVRTTGEALAGQKPVTATATDDEYFGAKRNLLVSIMNMSTELITFHKKILSTLVNKGAVYDEPQYTGDNYRAHATVQKQGRLYKGDEVVIDEIALIDMFPNNDIRQRKVLDSIHFSS